jgi:hypothetical protein
MRSRPPTRPATHHTINAVCLSIAVGSGRRRRRRRSSGQRLLASPRVAMVAAAAAVRCERLQMELGDIVVRTSGELPVPAIPARNPLVIAAIPSSSWPKKKAPQTPETSRTTLGNTQWFDTARHPLILPRVSTHASFPLTAAPLCAPLFS